MNEQELRTTLRRLAGHLHHLESELHDAPLHAPRYSQIDSHQSHGGPRPPTNLTQLNYLMEDVAPIITGWATNLAASATLTGLPTNQPLATWCAWLSRHRHTLLTMDWADDAVTELQELETELRHLIHPQDPNLQIEHRQTSKSVCYRLGNMGHRITPAQLRGWARRGHITSVDINGGHNGYLLTEVLEYLSKN